MVEVEHTPIPSDIVDGKLVPKYQRGDVVWIVPNYLVVNPLIMPEKHIILGPDVNYSYDEYGPVIKYYTDSCRHSTIDESKIFKTMEEAMPAQHVHNNSLLKREIDINAHNRGNMLNEIKQHKNSIRKHRYRLKKMK